MAVTQLMGKVQFGEADPVTPEQAALLIAPATSSAQGVMSASDKTKLDSLPAAGTNLLYRGDWSSATAYAVNDVVVNGGASYVCILARSATATVPGSDATHWTVLGGAGFSGAYADLSGKPTLGTSAALDVGTGSDDVAAGNAPAAAQAYAIQRANHTGTQLLSTISDAGDAASKNVGTGSGNVAAGDDSRLSDTRTPTDGSVTDAKVASNAAIAGTKIDPNFGAQRMLTKRDTNEQAINVVNYANSTLFAVVNDNDAGTMSVFDDAGNNHIVLSGQTGQVTATSFNGDGSALTNLPAGNLTGALPAIDGSALTGLPPPTTDAADLVTGTLDDARLSSNIPKKDTANTFTANQTISKSAAGDIAGMFVQNSSNTGVTVLFIGNDVASTSAGIVHQGSAVGGSWPNTNHAIKLYNGFAGPIVLDCENGSADSYVSFGTNNTERVRITNEGAVRIIPMASAPATPSEGDIYYDSGTHKHYGYNGSGWQALY